MGIRVQILAITVSVALIILIISLIRKRKLREEYSIIWLLAGLSLIVFSIWRGLLDRIAELIARVLAAPDDEGVQRVVRAEVETLCRKFPLYPERQR